MNNWLFNVLISFTFFLDFNSISTAEYIGEKTLRSANNAYLTIIIDDEDDLVTFYLSVDSDKWVGVGFGSTHMTNTYSIIGYNTEDIMERKLGHDVEGTLLTNTLNTINDTIINNIRYITVTRDITIDDSDYYDFSDVTHGSSIIVIWGIGFDTTWNITTSFSICEVFVFN